MIASVEIPLGGSLTSGPAPSLQLVCAEALAGSSSVAPSRTVAHRLFPGLMASILPPRERASVRCKTGLKAKNYLDCLLAGGTMRHFIAIFLFVVTGISAQAQNTGKRPFTFEDMMALKRIGGPQVSPDGKWVLFSAVHVDLQANKKIPHLWLVPVAGSEAKQLTSHPAGEDRGRWSPDGRQIIFTSSRDGGSQIWIADFDSNRGALGGPRKVTSLSTEADGAIWSPDGKNILFTSEVYPDCKDDACNKSRDEQRAGSKVRAMVFTRLFYRHWSSYTRFKRAHLFVVPAEGGAAKDITPGDHDVPPFSLGGQDLYAISPDGQEVAFTSNIDEVEAISTNNDVFLVPFTGGTPKKISNSPGSDSTPLYSPDGRFIAWRMQKR